MKQTMRRSIAAVILIAPVLSTTAVAEDRAAIDRTSIIGNRELPKVLYIVPWKKPLPGELAGRPVASVLDEALAPVDREVFRRQVHYDAQAHPATAASTPQPAEGGAAAPESARP